MAAIVVFCFVFAPHLPPDDRPSELIEQISNGDLDVDIRGSQRADEIGKVARSVTILRNQSKEAEMLRQERERVRGWKFQRQQNLIDATTVSPAPRSGSVVCFDQEFSSLNGSASDMEQIATLASTRSADAISIPNKCSIISKRFHKQQQACLTPSPKLVNRHRNPPKLQDVRAPKANIRAPCLNN